MHERSFNLSSHSLQTECHSRMYHISYLLCDIDDFSRSCDAITTFTRIIIYVQTLRRNFAQLSGFFNHIVQGIGNKWYFISTIKTYSFSKQNYRYTRCFLLNINMVVKPWIIVIVMRLITQKNLKLFYVNECNFVWRFT